MAMKVTNIIVHRLIVDMSCGCSMYAEFEDAQCKKGIATCSETVEGKENQFDRIFKSCVQHEKDVSLSMLKFIIGERLDEAVETKQKVPIRLHPIPNQIEEGDSSSVVAVGENVQTVARVNRPAAVTNRRPDPSAIKTMQRSPEQLKRAGAAPSRSMGGLAEMQIDEVDEDEDLTPHIADALDFLDTQESGLTE